jgi:hypothetical protein
MLLLPIWLATFAFILVLTEHVHRCFEREAIVLATGD